jgi:hypothetical protein
MTDYSYQVREHVVHKAIEVGVPLDVEAVVDAVLVEAPQSLGEALTVADEIIYEVGGRRAEFTEDTLFSPDLDWGQES